MNDSTTKRLENREINIKANELLMKKIKNLLDKENMTLHELAVCLGIEYKSVCAYFNKSRGYMFPATYYLKMIKYIRDKKTILDNA